MGLTVSKIDRGQMSEVSHQNERDCNSLNMHFMTIYCIFSATSGLVQSGLDYGDNGSRYMALGAFFL